MQEPKPSEHLKPEGGHATKVPIRLRAFSSWTALTTLLFCVGFLIAGGVLYYSYVRDHEASLTKRHFRNLETIARNLSDATKAFENVIDAAGQGGEYYEGMIPDSSFEDQRCFGNPVIRLRGEFKNVDVRQRLHWVKSSFAILCASSKLSDVWFSIDRHSSVTIPLHYLQKDKVTQALSLALDEGYEFGALESDSLTLRQPLEASDPPSKYRVMPEINGRRGLRLEKGLERKWKVLGPNNQCPDCRLTLHARFEPNLEELVPPETFTEVFVLDESGNVIVARSDKERSTDTRFEQLDRLMRQDPSPTLQGASSQPSDIAKQNLSLWDQLPLRKTIRIGDTDYYLYAQAVPIDSDLRGGRRSDRQSGRLKLIVAGLVPMSDVLWSALAIPHGVSLTLIFISFALTFTLPLIKLMTMGPRDRLGLTDALGCMLFSLMGTALFTFTIGAWTVHDHLKIVADERLDSAAISIKEAFNQELRELVSKLQRVTKNQNEFGTVQNVAVGQQLDKPLALTTIWIDSLGDIKKLETVRRTSIVTTNLRERPYVRDVWGNRLKSILIDKTELRFSIEPIFAWDDGELGTMLAMRAPKQAINSCALIELEGPPPSPDDFVVAIRSPMHSLVDAVVPVGYGYMVVAREGKVLYASDKNQILRENVFSETDNDLQLRNLIAAETSGTTRVNYRGRAHVMKLTKLHDSLDWTLILYRDTRWLDWVTDQSLFFGVALFTGYSLVILVAGLFVLIIFQSVRSGEGGWMWPAEGRSRVYISLMTSNTFFLLLTIVIIHQWSIKHPVRVSLGIVGVAALAMGVMVGVLKLVSSEKWREWLSAQGKSYQSGNRTAKYILGKFALWLWMGHPCQRVTWGTVADASEVPTLKKDGAYERGALSPKARWAYSGLSTTAIVIMAAMPAATFLTVGFQRALSLYESYSVEKFRQDISDREEDRKHWLQHILPTQEVKKIQWRSNISSNSKHRTHSWSNHFQDEEFFEITRYWCFVLKCEPENQSIELPNISAQPPEWFKETNRSLFHLWMWDPGKKLGGWIGHAVGNTEYAPKFLLFPETDNLLWFMPAFVLVLIVVVLGYARICEDTRLRAWRDGLLVVAFVGGLVTLIINSESTAKDTMGLPIRSVAQLAFGSVLLISVAYVCQRIVSHYLFLMDFAEPLVIREVSVAEYLTCSATTNRILIVLPPEGSGIRVPKELRNSQNVSTDDKVPIEHAKSLDQDCGDKAMWNFVSVPALLAKYEATDELRHRFFEKEELPLAIVGFDFRLSERRQAVRMLKLMERLSLQPNRPILVIAHRHPFDSEIVSFESSDIPVQDRSVVLSRDRWAEAFKDFIVIPLTLFKDAEVYETVILPIVKNPRSHTGWFTWKEKVMRATGSDLESDIRYALGVLRCRYEYWWADCTPSEKLALWHVATDHFLHAANSKLYPLIWKGLLKVDPDIKVRDKSFHQFVKQAGDRDELVLLRHDLKPSTWAKVSRPLLLGLLSAVMFLAVTQENVRDVVIAFAPVLPAFLIEIPRLLGGNIRAAISKET